MFWTIWTWNLLALLVALTLDGLVGDPARLWSRLPHPVVVIGRCIGWADARFNRRGSSSSDAAKRGRGVLLVAALLLGAILIGGALTLAARTLPLGWVIEGALASTLIAQRSLYEHVEAVLDALLADGLAGGRAAIAHIVGRDPATLDFAGVVRAGIESLAENFSDAVVAPAFWYAAAGLPGLLAYKALNTADSMVGHRTARHLHFGWAAARADDVANWAPSRIAGGILTAAAAMRRMRWRGALQAMRADAGAHTSPNAGWPEAAMAGALGLALAGPRTYAGRTVDGAWLNAQGRREVRTGDLRRALDLFATACWLTGGLAALLLALSVLF